MIEENLIFITCTRDHPLRMAQLSQCAASFRNISSLLWVVVENREQPSLEIGEFLKKAAIRHKHLAVHSTCYEGHVQREAALEFIASCCIEGVVYNADEFNRYDAELFEELRRTRFVAVLPVGNLGPNGIERPIVESGKIIGWDAGWASRAFPVSRAGFAFTHYCPVITS